MKNNCLLALLCVQFCSMNPFLRGSQTDKINKNDLYVQFCDEILKIGDENYHDVDPDNAKTESDYTDYWLSLALNREVLRKIHIAEKKFIKITGQFNDEGIFIEDENLSIYDGRVLVIVVSGLTVEKDVIQVFNNYIDYSLYTDRDKVELKLTSNNTENGKKSGELVVDRGNASGWFEEPIFWMIKEDKIVFIIEKKLEEVSHKFIVKKDPELVIGGIPINDRRSYKRFENSNRKELSKEFYERKFEE